MASLAFYALLGHPHLILVLALSTAIGFLLGRAMGQTRSEGWQRALLALGVGSNVLLLLVVKDLGVLVQASNRLLALLGTDRIRLPPEIASFGVSYFVFQAISYLVDVYLGTVQVERRWLRFALYMCFFPRLLQGPIERAGTFLPQLDRPNGFCYADARLGLLLFAWGFFKKTVAADELAGRLDVVWNHLGEASGHDLWLAFYGYAVQIYCDFSGYTDMALGVARLFGIELTQNFQNPYAATSIADFWRRWHISFSRWILDYIFRPLQLAWRRAGRLGVVAALMVTFVVCGLWHGMRGTFLLWGVLHGSYLAASVVSEPWRKRWRKRRGQAPGALGRLARQLVTFHLVCLAWVFFRAGTVGQALHFLRGLLAPGRAGHLVDSGAAGAGVTTTIEIVVLVFLVEWFSRGTAGGKRFFSWPTWVRWAAYYALALAILTFSASHRESSIYFQF